MSPINLNLTLTLGAGGGKAALPLLAKDSLGNTINPITQGDYYYLVFNDSGTLEVKKEIEFDCLLVGGGGGGSRGGGGTGGGGGGGAGGLIDSRNAILPTGSYSIIIGAGGSGVNVAEVGGNKGGDSKISNSLDEVIFTAFGGGLAGDYNDGGFSPSAGNINAGGSGGGCSGRTILAYGMGGAALQNNVPIGIGFGSRGGNRNSSLTTHGTGGGGAGGAGSDNGDGIAGAGKDMSSLYGTEWGVNGVFAAGGNGVAIASQASPVNGAANTGNGGSGISSLLLTYSGSGGSGVCIVRWSK